MESALPALEIVYGAAGNNGYIALDKQSTTMISAR